MVDIVSPLKTRARLLHRDVAFRQPEAVSRIQVLPELRRLDAADLPAAVKRRHCLSTIARGLGFEGWPHALAVLQGRDASDFGELLYTGQQSPTLNIWSASYAEARDIRRQHGGYLLAYRRHYLVVDADYVRALGLEAEDPDWERIGRDWVQPDDPEARKRLYLKLIEGRLPN